MGFLENTVRENRFTPEEIPKFESKLFFEGARRRPYLERFGVLLFLSTVIATMGVIAGSSATVIGAMIIAPLMTPIIASVTALLQGKTDRALKSTLIVLSGVVGVIALSWLIGLGVQSLGRFLSFDTNLQITGRISPRLVDLGAALASGAAGAFCMSRDDIADSLPGVAISISLVPPLCVVGLAFSASEWNAAGGALLLFLTNYFSILLAGSGMLALLGLGKASMPEASKATRRKAYVAIAIGVLIVTIPLTITSGRLVSQSQMQRRAKAAIETWAAETRFDIMEIEIDFVSERIDITVSGAEISQPSFSELVNDLETAHGGPVDIRLEIIPSQLQMHSGTVEEVSD